MEEKGGWICVFKVSRGKRNTLPIMKGHSCDVDIFTISSLTHYYMYPII